MKKTTQEMKRCIILLLFVCNNICFANVAYFSSFVAPTGQTIYCYVNNMTYSQDYISIVCANAQSNQNNWNGHTKPYGNLILPDSALGLPIWYIEDYAFNGCDELDTIVIPSQVKSIGPHSFDGCVGLTEVIFNAIDCQLVAYSGNISNGAFSQCSNLSSLVIGTNVQYLHDYLFKGCSGLSSITIPNSVIGIGISTFENCTGITSITIPNSILNVGAGAFKGCTNLTTINYTAINCMSFGTNNDPAFSFCPNIQTINIGNEVQSIGDYAFKGCSGVSSITFSTILSYIGVSAFAGCSGLLSITIPQNVAAIGNDAFSDCVIATVNFNAENCQQSLGTFQGLTSLTTLNIGSSVQYIPNNMFSGCTGLTSLTIPNSVTEIGSGAFSGCTGFTSITIPNGVTNIGSGAFGGCSNISTVNYNAVNCQANGTFQNLTNLTTLNIGSGVHYIPNSMFSGCTGLTSLTIPTSVTEIGSTAFSGCTGFTSITIPDGMTTIGSGAFSGCINIATVNYNAENCRQANGTFQNLANLTTLNIGTNVQYIPPYMFRGCSGLVSLNIPDAVTEIADGAFTECSNLTSATIGNGVSSIGNSVFAQCTRLTNVSLGESIETIGNSAFQNCGIIGELVIPQGVISIGNNGFKDCFGITEITCLGRVAPTLGTDAFDGVDTSITVNIPCGTTNLYSGRWSYFHNFNEIPFLFNVASADIAQGTVAMLQEPTCEDPVAIVEATPRNGYRFDHWSDGSTQNPYTYTAMGSLTLTAYFASTAEGIDDIDDAGIIVYAKDYQINIDKAFGEEVTVYTIDGRAIASLPKTTDHVAIPVTNTGVYIVKIGNHPARKIVVVR